MTVIIVLGLVIGLIMAITGAGGGILAVPLLIFFTDLNQVQAAPVGLFAVGVSASLAAALGLRAGIVRYRAALLMATSGMLLAPVGVWLADRLNAHVLNGLFAAVLIFVGVRGFMQARQDLHKALATNSVCNLNAEKTRFIWTTSCARALALFGGLAGLLSGLLGVGGGFVMVPALHRYTDLQLQMIVATSLAVIALVSMTGVTAAALGGRVDWVAALPFCGGALGGMVAGRVVANRLNSRLVHISFATIALIVAASMLIKSFVRAFF